jgi:hypothetical protein
LVPDCHAYARKDELTCQHEKIEDTGGADPVGYLLGNVVGNLIGYLSSNLVGIHLSNLLGNELGDIAGDLIGKPGG